MFGDPNCPAPSYFVYIDEAGDPGTKTIQPIDPKGSSEWFVLGAVVVAAEREASTVEWVREIKDSVYQRQRPDLHYRNLGQSRRLRACQIVASKELRAFALASHKVNMRGYKNERAATRGAQDPFYNWCVRVLLERVTAWCRARSMRLTGQPGAAQLIFSDRGGLRYSQLVAYHEYLRRQSASGALFLKARDIAWDVLHPDLYKSIPHVESAGAQLADVVASAFYQAVNTSSANWDVEPAMALGGRMAKEGGVTLMPLPPRVPQLSDQQKTIFRHYGFRI